MGDAMTGAVDVSITGLFDRMTLRTGRRYFLKSLSQILRWLPGQAGLLNTLWPSIYMGNEGDPRYPQSWIKNSDYDGVDCPGRCR